MPESMSSILRMSCIIITLVTIECGDFDDWAKSAVKILHAPLLTPPEDPPSSPGAVRIHSRHGQRFHCILPSDPGSRSLDMGSGEAISSGNISEYVRGVMTKLSEGDCLRVRQQWWSYEVCPGRHVRQYHEPSEHGATGIDHLLGKFVFGTNWSSFSASEEFPSGSGRYHSEYFTGGSVCDLTGEWRSAEVRYGCPVSAEGGEGESRAPLRRRIVDVTEPRSCHYVVSVLVPSFCRHWLFGSAAFRPPLLITCRPLLNAPQLRQLSAARADRVLSLERQACHKLNSLRCTDTLPLSCVENFGALLRKYGHLNMAVSDLTKRLTPGLPEFPSDVLKESYDALEQLYVDMPFISKQVCNRSLTAIAESVAAMNTTITTLHNRLLPNTSFDNHVDWDLPEIYQWLLDAERNSSQLVRAIGEASSLCQLTDRVSQPVRSAGRGSIRRLSDKEAFYRVLAGTRGEDVRGEGAPLQLQTISTEQRQMVMQTLRHKLQTVGVMTDLEQDLSVHVLSTSDSRSSASSGEVVLTSEEVSAFERLLSRVLLGGNGVYDKHVQHARMARNYRFSVENALREIGGSHNDEDWSDHSDDDDEET